MLIQPWEIKVLAYLYSWVALGLLLDIKQFIAKELEM
jgi:hypothetical protein